MWQFGTGAVRACVREYHIQNKFIWSKLHQILCVNYYNMWTSLFTLYQYM